MIDVVFQLLIFFICTASFQTAEELLPMGLAVTQSGQAAPPTDIERDPQRIVVRASREADKTRWLINGQAVRSLREVQSLLRTAMAINRSAAVTLDVADSVPLGDMIDMYDLCRLLGLEKIEFAVAAR
jgi:biopolymer transport protein ExbD